MMSVSLVTAWLQGRRHSPLALTHVDPQQRHQQRPPRLLSDRHPSPHRTAPQRGPCVETKLARDRLTNACGDDLASLGAKGLGRDRVAQGTGEQIEGLVVEVEL